jgi:hypothetical protein
MVVLIGGSLMGIGLAGRLGVLVAGALAVSGCGGSGTVQSYPQPYDPLGEYFVLLGAANRSGTTDMPVSGTAAYRGSGLMTFGTPLSSGFPASMAGRVNITADFENGTISGQMDRFRSPSYERINGSLDVGVGRVEGNLVLPYRVTGHLAMNGDRVDFDLEGGGRFVGPNARYLKLDAFGNVSSDAGPGFIAGDFVAERR